MAKNIDIEKISTDLQCDLIKKLAVAERFFYLQKELNSNRNTESKEKDWFDRYYKEFNSIYDRLKNRIDESSIDQTIFKEFKKYLLKEEDYIFTDNELQKLFLNINKIESANSSNTKKNNFFFSLKKNLLNKIVEKSHEELNADACAIFIIDCEGVNAEFLAGTDYYNETNIKGYKIVLPEDVIKKPANKNERLGITGWCISTNSPFISSNFEKIKDHPHFLGKNIDNIESKELKAYLVIPIIDPQGKTLGAIKAERIKGSEHFDVNEQLFLETMAVVAGRCLTHLQTSEGHCNELPISSENSFNTAIRAWVINVISSASAFVEELDKFLDIVVRVISASCLADSCSVFLIDDNYKILTQRAGCGNQVLRGVIRTYLIPDKVIDDPTKEERVGLTVFIAKRGETVNFKDNKDLKLHKHHKGNYDDMNYAHIKECSALVGVSLRIGGTITGVLKVENDTEKEKEDKRFFSIAIENRLDIITQNLAFAIERFKLQSINRNSVLLKANDIIFEILKGKSDVPSIVEKVVTETARLFNAKSCALFLKEGNELIQPTKWAAFGWAKNGSDVRKYSLVSGEIKEYPNSEEEKVGLTVWIAQKHKKLYTAKSNRELTMHPHHKGTFDKDNFQGNQKCESFMGIPLIVGKEGAGEELIGVMKVETKMKAESTENYTYFNEQDELVFQFIANSTAFAIKNARLVEVRVLENKINSIVNDKNAIIDTILFFIKDRYEVIDTLLNTQKAFEDKASAKKIIKCFIQLINPNFENQVLIDLKEQSISKYSEVFQLYYKSLTIGRLSEFESVHFLEENTLKNFISQEHIGFLNEISDSIVNVAKISPTNIPNKAALKLILDEIKKKQHNLQSNNNLIQKNLLDNIFYHWQKIIINELNEIICVDNLQTTNLKFFGNLKWGFNPSMNILLGQNGYGKTHLLRLILSLLQKDLKNSSDFLKEFKENDFIDFLKEKGLANFLKEKDLTNFLKEKDLTNFLKEKDFIDFLRVINLTEFIKEKGLTEFIKEKDLLDFIKEKDSKCELTISRDKIKETIVRNSSEFKSLTEKIPVLAIPAVRFMNRNKTQIFKQNDIIEGELTEIGAYHFLNMEPMDAFVQNFFFIFCKDYFTIRDSKASLEENLKKFPLARLIQDVIFNLTGNEFIFTKINSIVGRELYTMEVKSEDITDAVPIQRISEGTLSLLIVFGIIYNFLKVSYPYVNDSEIQSQSAIVFIDEIDVHLHPNWQQKVIRILRETFPNIQFFISAHSPLIVAGSLEGEVAVLRKGVNGFKIEQFYENFIGNTAAELYNKIFEIEDRDENYLKYSTVTDEELNKLNKRKDILLAKESTDKISIDDTNELKDTFKELNHIDSAKRIIEKKSTSTFLKNENVLLKAEVRRLEHELQKENQK